jgi:hypothetical protein
MWTVVTTAQNQIQVLSGCSVSTFFLKTWKKSFQDEIVPTLAVDSRTCTVLQLRVSLLKTSRVHLGT